MNKNKTQKTKEQLEDEAFDDYIKEINPAQKAYEKATEPAIKAYKKRIKEIENS